MEQFQILFQHDMNIGVALQTTVVNANIDAIFDAGDAAWR